MSWHKPHIVRCAVSFTAMIAVIVGIRLFPATDQQTAVSTAGATVTSSAMDMADNENPVIDTQDRLYSFDPSIELGPLPDFLEGAAPDISLRTDEQGNLVPERDLMTLIDFYLSALGEEPLDVVLSRIQLALDDQLNGSALAQAQDLLGRYVDYRIALGEIEDTDIQATPNGMSTASSLRQRFQEVAALRQELFSSEEDEAFFKLDNVQDEYMLQRLTIAENTSLDDQQRQQFVAALDQTLPEEIRALRQRVTQDASLYSATEALRHAGAKAEEIYKVRAETLGDKAAANLAELDRKRSQWDQRLTEYIRERNAIRKSALSDAERNMALNSLIESSFSELESLRVRALDAEL